MPTIKNRKREPLGVEQIKQLFPDGVAILDCDDGVCLVCKRDSYYDQTPIICGGEDSADKTSERYWADFTTLLKGKFLLLNSTMSDREPLENTVNNKLLGLQVKYTLGYY